jgi:hypothetical protein
MSFVHYTIFEEDSEEETKYSSFVDLEAFEESDEDAPSGFDGGEKGSEINPEPDNRSHVRPWDPSDIFFSFIY